MKLTEKQKNCPYCHDREDLLRSIPGHPSYLTIVQGKRGHWAEIFYRKDKEAEYLVYINYCPICGRPLGEEEDE